MNKLIKQDRLEFYSKLLLDFNKSLEYNIDFCFEFKWEIYRIEKRWTELYNKYFNDENWYEKIFEEIEDWMKFWEFKTNYILID